MKRKPRTIICGLMTAAILSVSILSLSGCEAKASDTQSGEALFKTPRERLSLEADDSPEWVTRLDAAENADQLFVVAGYERSTAWISMHKKDENGTWKMIMSTPGFIGKEGLGKTKEGDGMPPSAHSLSTKRSV